MVNITKKDYNKLDEYLRKLEISWDENEEKKYNKCLDEVLRKILLPRMKNCDRLFKELFNCFRYSGSFYEKLRIRKPDEFDINLELVLPSSDVKILSDKYPGFVQVQASPWDHNKVKNYFGDFKKGESLLQRKWMNNYSPCFLDREKVIKWIQSVVDKALNGLFIKNIKISRRQSGPAITLNVDWGLPEEGMTYFSVDLVPVFVFGIKEWPKPPVQQPIIRDYQQLEQWCVVPKASRDDQDATFWRMSFYMQERRIMNHLEHMKPTLKLIKFLRDCENWTNLSSYYIKTVFLWHRFEEGEQKNEFWKDGLGYLFVYMLKKFGGRLLETGSIPFFWDERHNLLSGLNSSEIEKIGHRMCNIAKKIDQSLKDGNPSHVMVYFKRSEPRDDSLEPEYQSSLEPWDDSPEPEYQPALQQPQELEPSGSQAAGILGAALGMGILTAGLAGGIAYLIQKFQRRD